MLSSKVLRLNLSEVYQYLNAESILHEMVEEKLITPQQKEGAESYRIKFAKNISAGIALFITMESPPTFLLSMCDILEARQCSEQRKLAVKLRSGKYS